MTLSNLPKSVRIAGHTVKVVVRDLDGDPYGCWSCDKKTITLDSSLRGKDLVETLRHEMLHAVFDLAGVGFSPGFPDENVIRALESLFFPAWDRVQKRLFQS